MRWERCLYLTHNVWYNLVYRIVIFSLSFVFDLFCFVQILPNLLLLTLLLRYLLSSFPFCTFSVFFFTQSATIFFWLFRCLLLFLFFISLSAYIYIMLKTANYLITFCFLFFSFFSLILFFYFIGRFVFVIVLDYSKISIFSLNVKLWRLTKLN